MATATKNPLRRLWDSVIHRTDLRDDDYRQYVDVRSRGLYDQH